MLEDIRLRPDKKATTRIAWRSLVDSFVQIPMRIVISPSVFVEYLAMWRDSLRTIDEVASFVRQRRRAVMFIHLMRQGEQRRNADAVIRRWTS